MKKINKEMIKPAVYILAIICWFFMIVLNKDKLVWYNTEIKNKNDYLELFEEKKQLNIVKYENNLIIKEKSIKNKEITEKIKEIDLKLNN